MGGRAQGNLSVSPLLLIFRIKDTRLHMASRRAAIRLGFLAAVPIASTPLRPAEGNARAWWNFGGMFGGRRFTGPSIPPRQPAVAGVPILMYQYEICPFCNKLKAVMDYCQV